jgi:hypothetical protein
MYLNHKPVPVALIGLLHFFGLLYLTSASTVISGYADAEDLLLAAYYGGQAHPPGYVLMIAPLHVFLHNIPLEYVVRAGHWWSVFFSLINIGLFYSFLFKLIKHADTILKVVSVLFSTLFFGLNWYFWGQATTLEIFPFATFLILVWLHLIQFFYLDNKKVVILSGIATGILLSFQPLHWILVLPVIVLIISKKPSWRWHWSGIGILTLLLLITLYSYWGQGRIYTWQTSSGFLGGLSSYFRTIYADGGSAAESYVKTFDIEQSIWSIGVFIKELAGSYGLMFTPLFIIGMRYLWAYHRKLFWWVASTLVCGVIFVFYMKFPQPAGTGGEEYFGGTAIRLRLLYMWHLVLALVGGFGIFQLFATAKQTSITRYRILISLFCGLTVLITWYRYPIVDASSANFSQLYSEKILNPLPKGVVLIVDSDRVFSMLASQALEGIRTDLTVIPARMVLQSNAWKTVVGDDFGNLPTNDFTLSLIVSRALQGNRVFLYAPSANLLRQLGVEGNPFFAIPTGYTIEVSLKPRETISFDYGLSASLAQYNPHQIEWWSWYEKAHMSSIHTGFAYFTTRAQQAQMAKAHLQLALALAVNEHDTLQASGLTTLAQERTYEQGNYLNYQVGDYDYWILKALTVNEIDRSSYQYFLERALLIDQGRLEAYERLNELYLETKQLERLSTVKQFFENSYR